MIARWALVVADFRREYHLSAVELAALSFPEFLWLLTGLSDASRWRQAWSDTPKHLYDPNEIAAVTAAARR